MQRFRSVPLYKLPLSFRFKTGRMPFYYRNGRRTERNGCIQTGSRHVKGLGEEVRPNLSYCFARQRASISPEDQIDGGYAADGMLWGPLP